MAASEFLVPRVWSGPFCTPTHPQNIVPMQNATPHGTPSPLATSVSDAQMLSQIEALAFGAPEVVQVTQADYRAYTRQMQAQQMQAQAMRAHQMQARQMQTQSMQAGGGVQHAYHHTQSAST